MTRIRAVFSLVALALLVPVGLLVQRALQSIAIERDQHHEVVANRIFDEMERQLSDVLRREEDRPVGHYQRVYEPLGTLNKGTAWSLSPLAGVPESPYVVGYFQLDHGGNFTSPMAGKRALENPQIASRVKRMEVAARRAWPRGVALPQPVDASYKQLPGTTVQLKQRAAPLAHKDEQQAPAQSDNVVDKLNFGTRKRKVRKTKTQTAPQYNVKPAGRAPAARDAAVEFADELQRRTRFGWTETEIGSEELDEIQVGLDPMAARRISEQDLLLYRVISVDGQAIRQGLLIDVPILASWLVDETVGSTDVAKLAQVSFNGHHLDAPYMYRRRFAEPFGEVTATVGLVALPDAPQASYVYVLSLLLLLVGTFGMFALYRMVAVVVGFAERRQNFVSAVSHELKTPLTAIRMHAEMLQEGMLLDEDRRDSYYRTITRETERLSRLINNVLELSRLEKGTREMALRAGPVEPVVREVVALMDGPARDAGFTIDVEIESDLPAVKFDRDALVQVVFNLVDNAIKYARDADDKRIVIRCERAGEGARLVVRDFGPGVPAPHLRQVFQPFYRAEKELTRTTKGSGIGLALVEGLVERMGGAVSGHNVDSGGFAVEIALAS